MKIKPTLLFLVATIFFLLLGIFAGNKALDIQLHDTYFIISYLHLSILSGFITGLTALIYFGLEKLGRPIKSRTGFLHFGLFITGLLTLIASIITPVTPTRYYGVENSYTDRISSSTAITLIGIILFLTSISVFLYGLLKSLLRK